MAERLVRLACALVLLPGLALAQTAETPIEVVESAEDHVRATAVVVRGPNEKIPDEAAHAKAQSQRERVRLVQQIGRYDCSDPATRTAVTTSLYDATAGWHVPVNRRDYRPLAVTARTSVADYPRELLEAGQPGAVGLLLFIDAEGKVARVEAACATDPAFIPASLRVVHDNRYRPSTLGGEPIRDLAYQIVAYGVIKD